MDKITNFGNNLYNKNNINIVSTQYLSSIKWSYYEQQIFGQPDYKFI
ncbi:hypothetical protein K661_02732 [Piscirickettsia salmonis LF-89 = ATCC VR-1361]|nr:hypothetical protein K661_02732 [Piscirickettsia salmonis LF-89 = ATCC VR-1361]